MESTVGKRVTKEESDESIAIYLGEENLNNLKSITPEDYQLFTSFNLNTKNSYFVKGSSKLLRKFKAYFIALCSFYRYSYATAMLKEYVEGLTDKADDMTSILGVERELLFLYLHREVSGLGNTDAWLCASTLDRVANRKRKGLVTVILSERSFPSFENSKELKVIDLGGYAKTINPSQVAEAVLKEKSEDTGTEVKTVYN